MNMRKYPRIAMTGLRVNISDDKGFFKGTVRDISRFGLALDNISVKMNSQADHLTVIIYGRGSHFKLRLNPTWENIAGRQKLVGGRIEQYSLAWTNFVMDFEPKSDDVWG